MMRPLLSCLAPLGALLVAAPASAQQLAGGNATDVSVLRVVVALLVCLGVAAVLAFVLRRRISVRGPGFRSLLRFTRGTSSPIEIIESRRVSQFGDLCLVRYRGTEFLLLCGPGGAQVLDRAQSGTDGPDPDV